jgi:hypothetical protein
MASYRFAGSGAAKALRAVISESGNQIRTPYRGVATRFSSHLLVCRSLGEGGIVVEYPSDAKGFASRSSHSGN